MTANSDSGYENDDSASQERVRFEWPLDRFRAEVVHSVFQNWWCVHGIQGSQLGPADNYDSDAYSEPAAEQVCRAQNSEAGDAGQRLGCCRCPLGHHNIEHPMHYAE